MVERLFEVVEWVCRRLYYYSQYCSEVLFTAIQVMQFNIFRDIQQISFHHLICCKTIICE